ncbi:MAG: hypothetical protein HFI81_10540 [Eubacterium sp.]|nr:hypothetical protein [Eubacterium sp.]
MPVRLKNIMDEYEIQVKLYMNERLFSKGVISKELYDKAKKMILKNVEEKAREI